MNRIIKFRAWDKINKRWLSWEIGTFRAGERNFAFEEIWGNGNYILLQFTGLTDKNGKEIYEGDVIHYKKDKGGWEGDETGVIKFYVSDGCYYLELEQDGSRQASLHELRQPYYEVIGNVWENPELIKQ